MAVQEQQPGHAFAGKPSYHQLMNLSKAAQRQGAGLAHLSEIASKSTDFAKRNCLLQNGGQSKGESEQETSE